MARKTRGAKAAAPLKKTAAVRAEGKATHENPLLPHHRLKAMHASMLAAQSFQKRAAALLKKQGAAGFTGREAALVGVFTHLMPQDRVSAAQGDVMPRLFRGAGGAEILRELRSKAPRATEENGVLPSLRQLQERLALAAGVALAGKMAKNESVVLAYIEADELDDAWLSVVKTAGRLELPIVFICLDSAGKRKQRERHWRHLHKAMTLKGGVELVPVIPVDGLDVVAMYRAAQESILRARTAIGPTVLWCERWQLGPKRDAVAEFEGYLAAKGLLPERRRKP